MGPLDGLRPPRRQNPLDGLLPVVVGGVVGGLAYEAIGKPLGRRLGIVKRNPMRPEFMRAEIKRLEDISKKTGWTFEEIGHLARIKRTDKGGRVAQSTKSDGSALSLTFDVPVSDVVNILAYGPQGSGPLRTHMTRSVLLAATAQAPDWRPAETIPEDYYANPRRRNPKSPADRAVDAVVARVGAPALREFFAKGGTLADVQLEYVIKSAWLEALTKKPRGRSQAQWMAEVSSALLRKHGIESRKRNPRSRRNPDEDLRQLARDAQTGQDPWPHPRLQAALARTGQYTALAQQHAQQRMTAAELKAPYREVRVCELKAGDVFSDDDRPDWQGRRHWEKKVCALSAFKSPNTPGCVYAVAYRNGMVGMVGSLDRVVRLVPQGAALIPPPPPPKPKRTVSPQAQFLKTKGLTMKKAMALDSAGKNALQAEFAEWLKGRKPNPATLQDAAESWARSLGLRVPARGSAGWRGMYVAWQRAVGGRRANPLTRKERDHELKWARLVVEGLVKKAMNKGMAARSSPYQDPVPLALAYANLARRDAAREGDIYQEAAWESAVQKLGGRRANPISDISGSGGHKAPPSRTVWATVTGRAERDLAEQYAKDVQGSRMGFWGDDWKSFVDEADPDWFEEDPDVEFNPRRRNPDADLRALERRAHQGDLVAYRAWVAESVRRGLIPTGLAATAITKGRTWQPKSPDPATWPFLRNRRANPRAKKIANRVEIVWPKGAMEAVANLYGAVHVNVARAVVRDRFPGWDLDMRHRRMPSPGANETYTLVWEKAGQPIVAADLDALEAALPIIVSGPPWPVLKWNPRRRRNPRCGNCGSGLAAGQDVCSVCWAGTRDDNPRRVKYGRVIYVPPAVACPLCKAAPGMPCTQTDGRPFLHAGRPNSHKARSGARARQEMGLPPPPDRKRAQRKPNPVLRLSTKDPRTMTPAQVNAELDKLRALDSARTDAMIAAGRGSWKYDPEIYAAVKQGDPLCLEIVAIANRKHALHAEITARMGPGYYNMAPGFKRRANPDADLRALESRAKQGDRDAIRKMFVEAVRRSDARLFKRAVSLAMLDPVFHAKFVAKYGSDLSRDIRAFRSLKKQNPGHALLALVGNPAPRRRNYHETSGTLASGFKLRLPADRVRGIVPLEQVRKLDPAAVAYGEAAFKDFHKGSAEVSEDVVAWDDGKKEVTIGWVGGEAPEVVYSGGQDKVPPGSMKGDSTWVHQTNEHGKTGPTYLVGLVPPPGQRDRRAPVTKDFMLLGGMKASRGWLRG